MIVEWWDERVMVALMVALRWLHLASRWLLSPAKHREMVLYEQALADLRAQPPDDEDE